MTSVNIVKHTLFKWLVCLQMNQFNLQIYVNQIAGWHLLLTFVHILGIVLP
jgi:hypothetical protein